jgi:uncharacterized protein YbjT (DUF2867 family)
MILITGATGNTGRALVEHPSQVELHGNFIRAAKQSGVRHMVRHSVRGADAGSPVKICRSHAESQRELEKTGL